MDLEYVNLSELSDAEIATRMRSFNYEKFKTLVRMHLSFELDLNTDEFDLPCHEVVYEDKGKLKKWHRVSKKHKHALSAATTGCAATVKGMSSSAGNSPTEGLQQQIDAGFLMHLPELKEFLLMEKNVTQEGIFRKAGSVSRQNELRVQIQHEQRLDMAASGYSVHDCATVFKGYLSELAEPLLTDAHYPAYLQIAPLCIGSTLHTVPTSYTSTSKPPNPERMKRDQQLLNSVQLLLLLLPEESRQLLQHIIEILHAVSLQQELNRMSADNLATLFAPHLICPRNLPPEALHYVARKMSGIIAYMVLRGKEIFDVPPKLATDIRAFFLERKRKKTMSPEQTLDDSISDISTVNTVYTFVDRERTAAAHTANNTDTELAQLYAHIQSLPESSKKRRLIKQFNKQNGQGTPLQVVVKNRLKNSEATRSAKSISDSIKKHIFHKSIMSRTPKRPPNAANPSGVETPNFCHAKNPKLRVLFQSPAPAAPTSSADMSTCTPTRSSYATIKTHPLQQIVASSALCLNTSCSSSSTASAHPIHFAPSSSEEVESSSCSSDSFLSQQKVKCASAPVSRQASGELSACVASSTASSSQSCKLLDTACCATPLKLISDAAKLLIGYDAGDDDKQTAAVWAQQQLLQIEEEAEHELPPNASPVEHDELETLKDLRSHYKSAPNLSLIIKETSKETQLDELEHTPIAKGGISITRKLMKGVSMNSLKLPFSTAQDTKKRLVRSVSSTLKRQPSMERQAYFHAGSYHACKSIVALAQLEDLDDKTYDESYTSSDSDECEAEFEELTANSNELPACHETDGFNTSCSSQRFRQEHSIYHNLNIMSSTPSLMLSRRSMSPITKSTQRMPKAMQESIMTPRSRKPVMVLTTNTLSSSEQNNTICQTDFASCREQHAADSQLAQCQAAQSEVSQCVDEIDTAVGTVKVATAEDALTHNFKEYLLTRSVLTASPVDSSFSSQPDDFGGSAPEVEYLDESQLSPSLLYCLDGNRPDIVAPEVTASETQPHTPLTTAEYRFKTNPFLMLNNARKRAATSNLNAVTQPTALSNASVSSKAETRADKENCDGATGYHLLSKKLLISEYPGETSF